MKNSCKAEWNADKRYSHDHDLIIPIYSNSDDPNNLTREEIIMAFTERVNYLLKNPEEIPDALGHIETHDFFN